LSDCEISDQEFAEALRVVRGGDFDEVKAALQKLGFEFWPGKDPNHWMYIHPLLKGDKFSRYPRNLYRQHGPRRGSDRITQLDAARARQMIRALQALVTSKRQEGDDE